jgi:hypothetical protein
MSLKLSSAECRSVGELTSWGRKLLTQSKSGSPLAPELDQTPQVFLFVLLLHAPNLRYRRSSSSPVFANASSMRGSKSLAMTLKSRLVPAQKARTAGRNCHAKAFAA